MTENFTLPQIQEYLAPFFPLPQSNLQLTGKHREDLPDDAQVRFWYGWWTLEELYKYGALPPRPYTELEIY